MRRRTFLSWLGFGWLVTRLPMLLSGFLAACAGQTQTAPKSADGYQSVGTIAELDQKGQLLIEQSPPILAVRDPGNAQAVVAVNPTCTHQGCLVNWKGERKAFACPCHGSAFAADGKVLEGPATKPLATYTAKVEGDKVLVKTG